jgi:hypothetical protein
MDKPGAFGALRRFAAECSSGATSNCVTKLGGGKEIKF